MIIEYASFAFFLRWVSFYTDCGCSHFGSFRLYYLEAVFLAFDNRPVLGTTEGDITHQAAVDFGFEIFCDASVGKNVSCQDFFAIIIKFIRDVMS